MIGFVSIAILALAVSLDGFGAGVMYGLRKIRIPPISIVIVSLCSGLVIYASMLAGVYLVRFLSPQAAKVIGAVIMIGIGVWAIIQMRRQRRQEDGTETETTDGTTDATGQAAAAGAADAAERAAGAVTGAADAAERAAGAVTGAADAAERAAGAVTGAAEQIATAPHGRAAVGAGQRHDVGLGRAPQGGGIDLRTVLRIELKRLGLVIEILRKPALADVDRSGLISPSEAVLLGVALSLDAFGAGIGAAFVGLDPLLTAGVIALASGLFIASGVRLDLSCADTRWLRKLSALPGVMLIAIGVIKLM